MRPLGQLSGNVDALESNHSTAQVILLEGRSPDRQIFSDKYSKLCL